MNDEATITVSLTDQELILLDGKVSAKVQKDIEGARLRIEAQLKHPSLNPAHSAFVADVVRYAKEAGKVIFQHKSIRYCKICKKSSGYVKFKSGPRIGKDNHDRPLFLSGIEMKDSFITFSESVYLGGCRSCLDEVKATLISELSKFPCQIPKSLTGVEPLYIRYDIMECSSCNWKGSQHLMGKLPAIMGGYYFGVCPQCKAENRPFGKTFIDKAEGFHLEPQTNTAP